MVGLGIEPEENTSPVPIRYQYVDYIFDWLVVEGVGHVWICLGPVQDLEFRGPP